MDKQKWQDLPWWKKAIVGFAAIVALYVGVVVFFVGGIADVMHYTNGDVGVATPTLIVGVAKILLAIPAGITAGVVVSVVTALLVKPFLAIKK